MNPETALAFINDMDRRCKTPNATVCPDCCLRFIHPPCKWEPGNGEIGYCLVVAQGARDFMRTLEAAK